MGDLAVFVLLTAGMSAVLVIGLALPGRLLDWLDRALLAPTADVEETIR